MCVVGSEDVAVFLSGFFLSLCGLGCWGIWDWSGLARASFSSGRGPVCGVVILLVAGHAGWPQSHARQMFQTELGPASSSSLLEAGGKWGLSFCPGQLPGPGEGGGPLIPSHGPAQERSLLCGHMRVGVGGGPQTQHPVASWAQEGHEPLCHGCATALAEPGLEETGGPGPSSAPPPAIPWRSHTVTDTVARPKADTAHNLPAGTQATLGSTHMYACSYGHIVALPATVPHTVPHFQPHPH